MSANRALIGLGCSLKIEPLKLLLFCELETNNSIRHNREILRNQDSIGRLFFAELSLSVSPPTLGVVCCEASESKSKGTEVADPLRPLKVLDSAS